MSLILSGTDGLSDVDGSAATPAIRGTDANTGIFFPAADTIAFAEGGTEAMRLDSAGNMGLGVTPTSGWFSSYKVFQFGTYGALFTNNDHVNIANNVFVNASGNEIYANSDFATMQRQVNGSHAWYTAPSGTAGNTISFTQAMTLDASGRLGIGTSSPAHVLDVSKSANESLVRINGSSSRAYFQSNASSFDIVSETSVGGPNALYLRNSGGGGLFIDSSGNVLVGTTTAGGGTARVYVNGDATNPAFRALANTATTSVYAGVFRHDSTTAGAYIQFVTDGNAETGRIYDLAGTMQYASSSDARLKTNVQPMQNGLQSVLALNPCTFDMRRGEDTFVASSGLIAQEVHEVYPFIVGVGGDDENTNPWSVDYGKLTPLLVAAIKEQQALITTLTDRITALETPTGTQA